MSSFVEKLDPESLAAFNQVVTRPFSEQAQFLMNAFATELQSEFEVIYHVLWECIKKVDMDNKGIQYVHQYQEGTELDFDMCLRLYEVIQAFFRDPKNKQWTTYTRSIPQDATAIVRKQHIRTIDVNFDSKVSFLEFLLFQYSLSPKDLMDRSKGNDEPPEVTKAKKALADVQRKVQEYEAEKHRLETESQLPGVKGLKAKNELAQLNSGPLAEELRRLLITAEAAVRIAVRKFGSGSGAAGGSGGSQEGAAWWMQTTIDVQKKKYGPQAR